MPVEEPSTASKADISLLLLPAQPDRVHPIDAVARLPPELDIEPERHGDDAEDSHRRLSCDLMSAGPDSSALRGFASGAVYLVSSGLMSACEFGSKLGFRDMNEREAFGWAVRSLRLYDWNPADPDKPRFQVNGDSLTFRELCERAKKLDEPLPEVIKYDLYPVLGRAPDLQAKLRLNETYSVAATCLLEFMIASTHDAAGRSRI